MRHVSLRGGGQNFGGLVSHLILGENYFIFKNAPKRVINIASRESGLNLERFLVVECFNVLSQV